MTLDEYIATLPIKLVGVKFKILERLWSEGNEFPRGWVTSSELVILTGQKYFDRRIREMRDNVGCDIESGTNNGKYTYRLKSLSLGIANLRMYLTQVQKRKLFEAADGRCAVCNRSFSSETRGLQADHKVPLSRGGALEFTNWQPLCVECNVGKRRACEGCELECNICPWAFPERVGRRIIVQVPANVEEAILRYSNDSGTDLITSVSEAISEYVANHRLESK